MNRGGAFARIVGGGGGGLERLCSRTEPRTHTCVRHQTTPQLYIDWSTVPAGLALMVDDGTGFVYAGSNEAYCSYCR